MKRLILTTFMLAALSGSSWGFCFEEAGEEYGISPEILYNIASVESSFNPAAVNVNANGSYDYGLMQINSSWAKTIGLKRWQSLSDPCTNVKTGAWILAQCLSRYGYTWQGIGCYNSRTPELNKKYALKIYKSMVKYRNQVPVRKQRTVTPMLVAAAKTEKKDQKEYVTPWEDVFGHDSE